MDAAPGGIPLLQAVIVQDHPHGPAVHRVNLGKFLLVQKDILDVRGNAVPKRKGAHHPILTRTSGSSLPAGAAAQPAGVLPLVVVRFLADLSQ